MRANNQNGFSLIEVVTAVTILGIIVLLTYRIMDNTSEAVQQASDTADRQHTVRVVFGRLTEELVSADWTQDTSGALFVGISRNEDGRPADVLRFRSRAHARTATDARESDVNLLDYSLDNKMLVRREEHNVLSLSETTVETDEIAGVASLNFRYWDGVSWRNDWDAKRAKSLPSAVFIELSLDGPSDPPETFTTTVTMPVSLPVPAEAAHETRP
jgi:type II secretion system protein J